MKALPIQKSKQHRLKVLVSDIDKNRYRVESVLTRLNHAHEEEDKCNVLQQLLREDLLSEDQFLRLRESEKDLLESPTIVEVIKETNIGRGINFLPRTIEDLKTKLPHLISDLIETAGLSSVRNELAAILKERCFAGKEYRSERYIVIKRDNNIL